MPKFKCDGCGYKIERPKTVSVGMVMDCPKCGQSTGVPLVGGPCANCVSPMVLKTRTGPVLLILLGVVFTYGAAFLLLAFGSTGFLTVVSGVLGVICVAAGIWSYSRARWRLQCAACPTAYLVRAPLGWERRPTSPTACPACGNDMKRAQLRYTVSNLYLLVFVLFLAWRAIADLLRGSVTLAAGWAVAATCMSLLAYRRLKVRSWKCSGCAIQLITAKPVVERTVQ